LSQAAGEQPSYDKTGSLVVIYGEKSGLAVLQRFRFIEERLVEAWEFRVFDNRQVIAESSRASLKRFVIRNSCDPACDSSVPLLGRSAMAQASRMGFASFSSCQVEIEKNHGSSPVGLGGMADPQRQRFCGTGFTPQNRPPMARSG
jgi:hypothetical protein